MSPGFARAPCGRRATAPPSRPAPRRAPSAAACSQQQRRARRGRPPCCGWVHLEHLDVEIRPERGGDLAGEAREQVHAHGHVAWTARCSSPPPPRAAPRDSSAVSPVVPITWAIPRSAHRRATPPSSPRARVKSITASAAGRSRRADRRRSRRPSARQAGDRARVPADRVRGPPASGRAAEHAAVGLGDRAGSAIRPIRPAAPTTASRMSLIEKPPSLVAGIGRPRAEGKPRRAIGVGAPRYRPSPSGAPARRIVPGGFLLGEHLREPRRQALALELDEAEPWNRTACSRADGGPSSGSPPG